MLILLVDDHPLFLEGIKPLLEKLHNNVELLIAQSFQSAHDFMDSHPDIELVLLDLNLPDTDGFILLQASLERLPETPVVMLTASTQRSDMQRTLSKGARGYICKSSAPAIVLNALNLVLAGGIYIPPEMVQQSQASYLEKNLASDMNVELSDVHLTPRQREVLDLLVDGRGLSNKHIARFLDCSEATVKAHVTALLKTMNVKNRGQVKKAAEELGLLPAS